MRAFRKTSGTKPIPCALLRAPSCRGSTGCRQRRRSCGAAAGASAAEGAGADPIVSTQWLAANLEDVAILDVRGRVDTATLEPGVEKSTYISGYDDYLEGHIPGAVFFNWTKDGVDASQAAPVQLEADSDAFHAMLEAKGVDSERPVVVYDGGDGMLAARLWWALTVHGHPAPRILEGGWARWRAEGRALELYEPCTLKVSTTFDAANAAPRPELRVTVDELAAALAAAAASPSSTAGSSSDSGGGGGGDLLIVDTRNWEQYTGQVRRGPRGGRIPGAVSLPRRELLDPATGWLLPLEEQRAVLLERLGLTEAELPGASGGGGGGGGGRRVVLYCNGGVAACTAALALSRLGHASWAVYDGSWNEWGARGELPLEVGGGGE
ncbi:MAG: rhodanese domain-containing protein [Monoraphidium minutum]|nr:MAG: rhodanese domain-containing protein [Monoraphidium minutum]